MAKHRRTVGADFGRTLGRIGVRVEAVRKQRQAIAAEINDVLASARNLLAELSGNQTALPKRARHKLSPEGRARIRAAQKKRWANYHGKQASAKG